MEETALSTLVEHRFASSFYRHHFKSMFIKKSTRNTKGFLSMGSLLSVNYLKKYAKQYFKDNMYTQADQCFISVPKNMS